MKSTLQYNQSIFINSRVQYLLSLKHIGDKHTIYFAISQITLHETMAQIATISEERGQPLIHCEALDRRKSSTHIRYLKAPLREKVFENYKTSTER